MTAVVIIVLAFVAKSTWKIKFRRQLRKDRFRENYLREMLLSPAHFSSFQKSLDADRNTNGGWSGCHFLNSVAVEGVESDKFPF